MHPAELRVISMQAAEYLRYPAIKKFLEEQLDPEMQDLAMKLCLIFVCTSIADL